MNDGAHSRPVSLAALLATAIATGAFAGLVAGGFIWLIEQGTAFVWSDLPDAVGVDPYESWWLFLIPIVGGALVGVGQMVLGNYPRPLEEAVATWRQGGHIEPVVAPKTAGNSLVALIAGGPVGFEAALTGVLGGTATWVGSRITTVGELVRNAWGVDEVDDVPRTVHRLPYWLAAIASLLTYRWLPFGGIDLGFRFTDFDGDLGIGPGLTAFAFGVVLAVPVAWAIKYVQLAERSMQFRRSPILIGMAGGLAFALLALPNELVLFSGQEGIQLLPEAPNGELIYVAIAKWVALVVALFAGWRGGPIFPICTSVAALAVLADELVDVGPDIMIVAAIAAAAVVFVKGSLPMAVVLALYPVQMSYAVVIIVGCLGGAVGLAVARSLGVLPLPPAEHEPVETTA